MNKGLAHILMVRLTAIPFIDLFAGLVQVQEQDDLIEEGKKITTRYPVSCDIMDGGNCPEDPGKLVSLIPDSKRKGILYFEDNGTDFVGRKGPFYDYKSSLRLVCWLNTSYINLNSCHDLSTPVITSIIDNLTASIFHSGYYTKIHVSVSRIPVANKDIFRAYTYNNTVNQYLMQPFETFAIDFSVTWSMHHNCIDDITLKEPLC